MAIFGSLGKALGLDSPSGRGFVTGFAEGVSRLAQKDIDRTLDMVDRTSDYRVRRTAEEASRFDKEEAENLEIIKNMSGKMGDVGAVHYLIDKFGFKGAQERVEKIASIADYLGEKPVDLIGLDQSTAANGATLDQMATFVTRPMTPFKTAGVAGKAPGIMGMFGYDVGEAAEQQSEQMLRGIGISQASYRTPDLGEAPTAEGLDPNLLGMLKDPGDEANRMFTQYYRFMKAGDQERANIALASAKEFQTIDNIKSGKPLTISETNSVTSKIVKHLSLKHNLKSDFGGDYQYRFAIDKAEDYSRALEATAKMTQAFEDMIMSGMSPQQANSVVIEAITRNRNIVKVDDPSAEFMFTVDSSEEGSPLFTPSTGTPPPAASSASTNTTAGSVSSNQNVVDTIVASYPTANVAAKQAAVARLRSLNYSDDDIKRLLNVSQLP
jgi:hypothetical protein